MGHNLGIILLVNKIQNRVKDKETCLGIWALSNRGRLQSYLVTRSYWIE